MIKFKIKKEHIANYLAIVEENDKVTLITKNGFLDLIIYRKYTSNYINPLTFREREEIVKSIKPGSPVKVFIPGFKGTEKPECLVRSVTPEEHKKMISHMEEDSESRRVVYHMEKSTKKR